MLKINSPIVSPNWLQEHLNELNLVILDATIKKVTTKTSISETFGRIKNTRFIALKTEFSDTTAEFPNTMLSPIAFSKAAQALGINNSSAIVVYDTVGIYSSARVWWMFKAMGHHNIAVLDGGLPAWTAAGFSVEKQQNYSESKGDFSANYNAAFFYTYRHMLDVITDSNKLILDARSTERFHGTVPEPRKGLRSGQIPNSNSLPYTKLLKDGKMRSKEELAILFTKILKTDKKLIFSCGSGITACVLALGAAIAGIKNTAIYDGSWTEWGSLYSE